VASYFVDSSALAKLYHPELGTPAMDRIAVAAEAEIYISRLTLVEIPSVFAIKVRTNFITREDAALALRRFHEDITTWKFAVAAIREPQFALAELLIERYAFSLRLRALDALQLAIALKLKEGFQVDHFVASDQVLCQVAESEGFSVLNPGLS
jgi:predicted nucleic acid-binding protein